MISHDRIAYLSAAMMDSGTSLEFIPMGLLAAMCMATSLAAASEPSYSTITPKGKRMGCVRHEEREWEGSDMGRDEWSVSVMGREEGDG